MKFLDKIYDKVADRVIDKAVNKVGKDKFLHFVVGYLAFCILTVIFSFITPTIVAVSLAYLGVLAAASGKEIYDRVSGTGTPEIWDFLATMLGAVPASILIFILV